MSIKQFPGPRGKRPPPPPTGTSNENGSPASGGKSDGAIPPQSDLPTIESINAELTDIAARMAATHAPRAERVRPTPSRYVPAATVQCERCHDMGMVKQLCADGDRGGPAPADRYRVVPCICRAPAMAAQRAERIRSASNLTPEMERMTFASYDQTWDRPAYATAWAFAQAATAHTPDSPPFLMLMGTYGSGKTHLLAAIAHHTMAQGRQPLFVVVPSLLDWLKSAFGHQSRSAEDQDAFQARFDGICNTDILLLDDLGAEHSTSWAQEKLFQIVNHRYARRLPTVVSTNCLLSQIEPRIASRLGDLMVCRQVTTTAQDYRQRPKHTKRGA